MKLPDKLSTRKQLDEFFNNFAILKVAEQYREPKPDFYKTLSLDAPVPYTDGLTLHDIIPSAA